MSDNIRLVITIILLIPVSFILGWVGKVVLYFMFACVASIKNKKKVK